MPHPVKPWPYPRWIAHRGAGQLAPENTLAAFRVGASHGYRMFECDVKLSLDGVPFLLHDDTLVRTSNAHEQLGAGLSAVGGDHPWATLSQLDAGSWHSRAFAGEPLASLGAIAHFCLANAYCLNLEIKPTPGLERQTGAVVAEHAARLWADAAVPPLLSSFDVQSLQAAQGAQPQLPRALLLDSLWSGWLETARSLDCVAIVCEQLLWDAASSSQARSAGFRLLSYTVNEPTQAQRLIDLGLDGLITDRIDCFAPARQPPAN
ncbi:MAG: glycerophosphodiester phosphodiesterase [Gammaproteobacteria bacterium]|uniref:glycerophosphodiester phosphodiesterase n=1 Tax=Rhodoferax sp. TaxID=50421 RepID=UPI0017CAE04F|nr:glycerophosphodiester phosphodiesterase [Rhodoferax sp.]MBU3897400.1 glycerophosphodiester phosphodiesterase [Gammaproteobacteria bacterium]MBA3057140.1 glycerophosphodiester phosphodiesterase [Rhodoferax sp.]MBU3999279.1 glycerophosphodiester phosphodiesterase [Gammaproteobacteria bacterium]MBU4018746.1 glycerophosphodiester phosphodiesterase [Gammaproteobacteria bacterium]MBU4079701.1 glycerophosphodiester phosphodiesterase [Gammaproteobacteria bacterium]